MFQILLTSQFLLLLLLLLLIFDVVVVVVVVVVVWLIFDVAYISDVLRSTRPCCLYIGAVPKP